MKIVNFLRVKTNKIIVKREKYKNFNNVKTNKYLILKRQTKFAKFN